MLDLGVNRISINPQTMQDDILRRIGRGHSARDIDELLQYVKHNTSLAVNMDFIAGLPNQTMQNMIENMDYVCQNLPENVTIHTLALKRGSPLYDLNMQDDILRNISWQTWYNMVKSVLKRLAMYHIIYIVNNI